MNEQTLAKDITLVIVFVLSWVNNLLVQNGHRPIPVIDENQVSWTITFVVSVWALASKSPLKSLFAKKAAPVVPAQPAVPVQPVAPAQPVQPVQPVAPAPQSAEPVQPVSQDANSK